MKPKQLALEVYDPSYFIDFSFADKDPIKLVGAPAACQLKFERPNEATRQREAAQREQFHGRRQLELRRDVRQQDHGGLPVSAQSGLAREPGDLR